MSRREAVVPKGAFCFGCNQSFEGNPVGLQFDSDLLDEAARAELRGRYFHPGHLRHYARRRGWERLVQFLATQPPRAY